MRDSLLEQDFVIGLHVRYVLGPERMVRHVAPADRPVPVVKPVLVLRSSETYRTRHVLRGHRGILRVLWV